MAAGYKDEACAWRQWVLRAAAGNPDKLQIMYGLGGERRLTEWEVDWLPGYEGRAPCASVTAPPASSNSTCTANCSTPCISHGGSDWRRSRRRGTWKRPSVRFLESAWQKPDQGIWEVRGPQRHFTHSKVMAWVAFDRAVKAVEKFGVEGPVDRWRDVRDTLHRQVCERVSTRK